MTLDKKVVKPTPYYHRAATTLLERYASIYPAVMINGPRQSGKTTLARTTFPDMPYVSIEDFNVQQQIAKDPYEFLARYEMGAIFDEVQHAPQLLSYLQKVIDERDENGRFIITGSQNFALSQTVTQSLAGRVGQITLLPLSVQELGSTLSPLELALQGGYPRLHKNNMLPHEFYPSYIGNYIERDVRQIKNIGDLTQFQNFLLLCAGRTGQLLNINALAQDCGIAQTTAQKWLTVLEASYIIFRLKPYHNNFNKRLTKQQKLYFYDTGLAASLLNVQTAEQLTSHFARGALFENLIVLEVLKNRLNRGIPPHLYFWRDSAGREVDLIDEWTGQISAFEIKSSQTFQPDDTKGLAYFAGLAPNVATYVLYGRKQAGAYGIVQLIALEDVEEVLK
ncbi:MAG: uncharacterized protein QG632_473 [Candidatus Dependentiae bacterium]|nr:uncharacterized protein [Candidatus Dependentiae bacterium]